MKIIDLTKPLHAGTAVYRDGAYSDPAIIIAPWCAIADQGFRVSRLELGTQSGTHIDAPAHFCEDGDTLDRLDASFLIGPYFHVHASALAPERRGATLRRHDGERILFLATEGAMIDPAALEELMHLPCKVWVIASPVRVADRPETWLNAELARRGLYLVEDLDEVAARTVPPTGQIAALPMRLAGVSGAPCRVVATC